MERTHWYKKLILQVISIPKVYTFIYITVRVQKFTAPNIFPRGGHQNMLVYTCMNIGFKNTP